MGRTYQDAASRWAGVGPYYAMFPVEFANKVVKEYTHPGDVVLDPFAGRGTSIFSAATQERLAIGIEISPVGYVYSKAKLNPATQDEVEYRLDEIGDLANQYKEEAECLPHFFHRCFSEQVRRFLIAARTNLNWRDNQIDLTVMALLLVHLHGKQGSALSNQMRQTKSMSPQYAIRWWDDHGYDPPDIDPVTFIRKKLSWRYAKGVPNTSDSWVYLGDSLEKLTTLCDEAKDGSLPHANLLFTSPPYYAITNYHYDQWIRLWLLGGHPDTSNGRGGGFENRDGYRLLLEQVFTKSAKLLHEDATIYVRTDYREFTRQTTLSVLRMIFPDKRLTEVRRPMLRPSQTHLFGNHGISGKVCNGEVDIIVESK